MKTKILDFVIFSKVIGLLQVLPGTMQAISCTHMYPTRILLLLHVVDMKSHLFTDRCNMSCTNMSNMYVCHVVCM